MVDQKFRKQTRPMQPFNLTILFFKMKNIASYVLHNTWLGQTTIYGRTLHYHNLSYKSNILVIKMTGLLPTFIDYTSRLLLINMSIKKTAAVVYIKIWHHVRILQQSPTSISFHTLPYITEIAGYITLHSHIFTVHQNSSSSHKSQIKEETAQQ